MRTAMSDAKPNEKGEITVKSSPSDLVLPPIGYPVCIYGQGTTYTGNVVSVDTQANTYTVKVTESHKRGFRS